MTKAHKVDVEPVSQEIQRLLSYKNESGWFVLTKGSTVMTTGHGFTILKVFEDFEKWKEVVKEKGFESTIKEYHNMALLTEWQCCWLDIPTMAGKVPEMTKCPECTRVMETFIDYRCCHIVDGITTKAHH
ncbi:Sieve element occlusion, C-terminal [Parasponia andersonii]|uniref:Sieve element occlusion, C-terminal n=1 Tax=Parasponia andersonii TaxID=3476 RepID=A0A2P5BWS9_PARAD|nr:Sieve element occlusion, C-terminal [Parasponia andersonii]